MIIKELVIYTEKGKPGTVCSSVEAVCDKGLEGDRFAKGGDRQVALISEDVLGLMKSEEHKSEFGICARKFKANIVISGEDYAEVKTGDVLVLGDAQLTVTTGEKECFPEDCTIAAEGKSCLLKFGGKFAAVTGSGTIHTGDTINFGGNDR